jgi:diguanylate cyclase (GGDEF)-like protein/PAS domain S-box-containing protein
MTANTHALIVDDKEENLYYLQALLTGNGYTVQTAYDGQEALAQARRCPPDIVISDLLMPVMDGFTLLRHWKADVVLKHAPFIVYTATYGDPADERLARSLGADAFILKPAEPEIFLAKLRQVLTNAATVVADPPKSLVEDEKVLLKVYSEVLIRKLEEKTLQLEQSNRALQEDIAERVRAEKALHESERRFSNMMADIQLASVMLDREGRITYCNDYLLRLTGWSYEDVAGRNWFEVFIPLQFNGDTNFFATLLENAPDTWHRENEILTRAGQPRLMRWHNLVLRSATGSVVGSASIGEDVTEQKQVEIRIRHLNRVYAMLSGINALIVRVRSRDELFSEACRIAVEQGGFHMSLIGTFDSTLQKFAPVASAGKDDELLASIKDLFASNDGTHKSLVGLAMRRKGAVVSNDSQGDPRVVLGNTFAESGVRSLAVFPLVVSDQVAGALILYASEIGFFHEEEMKLLTELAGDVAFGIDHIEKQERLDYLAFYDSLTGLANRSLFIERLSQHIFNAAKNENKLAVALIDLERFKNINDTVGQAGGDTLLKAVADWLASAMGDASMLARIDADHFALVLPEVSHESEVARLIQNSRQAFLDHPFQVNDAVFRITAKIGIALFPDDGADAITLFRHAEAALKKAKASGDRYLFYTQQMTEAVAGKISLENRLRQALEKDEFVLHYQPKVSLRTNKVTGAEALIRWNDPHTGLVAPARFIPMLEETGLIHEVGRWALHTAIRDYLRWRAMGLSAVRIAVNVSPLQLRSTDFVAEVRQAIDGDAQAWAGLELEITESLIMEDIKHSIVSLKSIRAMGVTIAIDDFGTGFSSLNYLAKLPVDTLKIDRSFVSDMTAAPEGLALVSTIINLAHSLKLNVVAEGVETEEQSRLLVLLSCDEMQGYLFSKPLRADLFETKYLCQDKS